jgi:ribonuclease R
MPRSRRRIPPPVKKDRPFTLSRGARPGSAGLPEAVVIERVGEDEDGVPLARPLAWPGRSSPPTLRIIEAPGGEALPIGARAAARLIRRDSGEIEARIIRRLDTGPVRVAGVYHRGREGGRVVPADRRQGGEYRVSDADAAGAVQGELVVVEPLPPRRFGAPYARIIERLGSATAPGAVSRLAIAAHDIPTVFPPDALAEAEAAPDFALAGRVDLRDLPLVTIDGEDARDFDDAVWAQAEGEGWHLIVAIADVAWYVRPGTVLDREAERRGNSVYFPDRVVPMLPEALSNGLCSLKPAVDRACLAVHLWIDAEGRKHRHRFERAVMRSAARLTYEGVQAVRNGRAAMPAAIPGELLATLYGAYAALALARARRGALEIDLPEYRVLLDDTGRPSAIRPRARYDSHRLIEEFMILANVAAAEELAGRGRRPVYRVHDAPDPEKLGELSDVLSRMGIPGLPLAKGQAPRPALFNRLLRRAAETPNAALVNELVLRAQAQAVYSPANLGHFGLALRQYVHFTSPIRRYADLLVHRALIAAGNAAGRNFGAGELPAALGEDALKAIGEHISMTERRAAAAERSAIERYRAMLLADAIGARFAARISGVAEFGLFVSLPETGAEGLVPIAILGDDFYDHDASRRRLVGRRSRRSFTLGDEVAVRLLDADSLAGRLVFRLER